jgi:alpha-tubulin suppressor-like RCC1 family protein
LNVSSWTNIRAIAAGAYHTIGLKGDGTFVTAGYNYYGQLNVFSWTTIKAIAAGYYYTVGLKEDGTVVAVGQCGSDSGQVSSWTNIKAVTAGAYHTVGLKEDGTVVAVGGNSYGQLDVSSWTNIKAVAAGYGHTVGLKEDGTLVSVGYHWFGQRDVSGFTNIKAIAAGFYHTVGLKEDGTVVAVGDNVYGELNVSSWTNIKAVAAGLYYIVALKEDGTVVAAGYNGDGELNVSSWTNIKAIAAGRNHTVGLKEDGTVVAVGDNTYGELNVSSWTNIKAVAAGMYNTIGLKEDGTFVAVGYNGFGQLNLYSWENLKQSVCEDTTPPVTTCAISGTTGNNGWYLSDVQATCTATDNEGGSGVDKIHYTIDSVGGIISGDTGTASIQGDGTHTFTYYAVDTAGNAETAHSLTINIDKTAPTITASATPSANENGWNNSDVSVSFTCNDATSGVESCTGLITVTTEGADQVITGTVVDFAGITASASITLNIDKTPPVITITGVTDGAVYTVGAVPEPGYTATDDLSGVESRNATLTGGSANGVGTYTYTVDATDNAGNSATASPSYSVVYSFSGFLSPVSLDKPFKLGSTIPVKFRLADASGTYISTSNAAITVQKYSDFQPAGDPIDGSSTSGADTGNTFRYDAANNLYIFNLSTSGLSGGTWLIQAVLDDGTVKTAFISLRAI